MVSKKYKIHKKKKQMKKRIDEVKSKASEYVKIARKEMPKIKENLKMAANETTKNLNGRIKHDMPKLQTKAYKAAEYVEKFVNEHLDGSDESIDEKIEELKELIKKEPMKAVSASFLLGVLVGRLIK